MRGLSSLASASVAVYGFETIKPDPDTSEIASIRTIQP
jgi:hypothetical protein